MKVGSRNRRAWTCALCDKRVFYSRRAWTVHLWSVHRIAVLKRIRWKERVAVAAKNAP